MEPASMGPAPMGPAVVTCALTGVLTDPAQHGVPVTPAQMAAEAKAAWDAGATVVHLHYRRQEPGMGRLPSWDPDVAAAIVDAIRAACPGLLINSSTGVVGPDTSGPFAVLDRVKPEIAALNAGSLNYLKARTDGRWAWPPLLFDNPVEKIEAFVRKMGALGIVPECECFDTGIVRSLKLFEQVGLLRQPYHVSFVMGVESGMPADPRWLPLLVEQLPAGAHWQTIGIGRQEVWALHQRAAELGGDVRTGLEDTFYLPDGSKATSNGALVEALVKLVRAAGREPATAAEARAAFGIA
ncbi:MAG: 3-keto-5-aminohexanoate cleavage protein [Myxococcota bacterium]